MNELELKEAYERQKPAFQAWGAIVVRRVEGELQNRVSKPVSEFLKLYPVVPRVKATSSFLTKALTRKNYKNPLTDTTDLVGVRFVVLLRSEIQILSEIIESCPLWEWRKDKDFKEEIESEPNHFDYQSDHYIVRAAKPQVEGEVSIPIGVACEIQVRTLLQHAYAELAHDRTYKSPAAIMSTVRRDVAKSAALVETTDEIFQTVDEHLEAAMRHLRELHRKAIDCYKGIVRISYIDSFEFSRRVLIPYTIKFQEIPADALDSFLQSKDYIGGKVAERAQVEIIYSHPVVLWVYYLIYKYPRFVPNHWPFDQTYLIDIYADLGISAEG